MSFLQRAAQRLGFVPAAVARQQADDAARTAHRRVAAQAAQHQRSLLAALTTNDVASWQAAGLHINAETAEGLVTVRARSRDAAINNGYARQFLGMLRSNVLGPKGVGYQSRLRTAGGGLRTADNNRLEAGWKAYGKAGVLDVTGRYTMRALERLALRHAAVDGECFVRLHPGRGPHGLQVQLLPADVVPVTLRRDLGGGRRVRQGIEIDAEGRVLAYHMRADDATDDLIGEWAGSSVRTVRVPADEVIHVMLPEQATQLRGVPWMAAALKRMYQAADFASSGLNKARESAKRGGWLTTSPDVEPAQLAQLTDGEEADGTSYASLHDGTWEKLPAGLTPQAFDSDYPNIEYGQFIKDCARDIAGALNCAYFTLGNDLEAVNYSSGQLGMQNERTMWETLQQWFVEDTLTQPLHRAWLRYALIAAPELAGLSYARLEQYAEAARWQLHRWKPLDEEKTVKAQSARIAARLSSPQRVIAENGDDPDEIVAELLEWQQKTQGLPALQPASGGQAAELPDESEDDTRRRLALVASRSME